MKRSELVDKSEILLFDILQELIRLNYTMEGLIGLNIPNVNLPSQDKTEALKPVSVQVKDNLCKHCNGTHENKGQELACAKKNKKKE
jgi:broad specificity polyphosphatase/5'/3'-nucleotidase SurE